MPRLEFFFNGWEVGCFEESEYPSTDGHYRFEPYRGSGHYHMATRLRSAKAARCYYPAADRWVMFEVKEYPERGVLALATFERCPRHGHAVEPLGPGIPDWWNRGLCPRCSVKIEPFQMAVCESETCRGYRCPGCGWSAMHTVLPKLAALDTEEGEDVGQKPIE